MSKERWEELKRALEVSKAYRAAQEEAWDKYLRLYSNRPDDGRCSVPEDLPVSQLCASTVEIMVAAGQVAKPKVLAKPRRKEEIGPSRIVEAFLDYWWDKYRIQKEIIRADYNAKIFGHGWLRTSWVYRERTKARDLRPPAEYVDAMVASAEDIAKVADPAVVPTEADVERYLRKQMRQVAIDQPVITCVSNYDMWVDPQARVFEQRRWVCQRSYRRVEEVRKDRTLNGKRANVRGVAMETSSHGGFNADRRSGDINETMLRAEMWEMWDYEEERLYVWSTGCDDLLLDIEWPDAVGDPYTFIPCYEVSQHFYPRGVIEMIASMVWEVDDLLYEQMLARRRQRVVSFMRSGDMTEDVRRGLESGVDRLVLPVDIPDTRPLSDIIFTTTPPPVNPELYRQEDAMKGRMYQATGISEYQRGYADSARTATEVDTINQYSTARVRLMVDGVQSAMVDVARKLVGLAQQYLTRGDVVRLVGLKEYQDAMEVSADSFMDGPELVVPFTRKDIAGEFDFKLEPSSALPDGEQAQKQAALQLSQILLAMPETNHVELIRYLIQAFRLPDADRFILEPPPGMGAPLPPQEGITVSAQPGLSTVQPRPGASMKPDPQQMAQAGMANRS